MEVTSVLVDDIGVGCDSVTASVVASLYEFPEPRWVTVHPERGNFSVGPLALVQP
ncbi:MAG: hypothetical protein HW403_1246, partial [Dehalococcoidia bacterium]|nr:hypothetical protein [Dehalococcoidia bacterium]